MQHILWVVLGRIEIMTTAKSKLLVDSQNSFLVYHYKSLKLVQNSAMNETFIIKAEHYISKKVSEYRQEIPHSLLQINPGHREGEQQNTYSKKTSGRQLKQSNYHSLPRHCANKNRNNITRCIIKERPTQNPHKYSEVH